MPSHLSVPRRRKSVPLGLQTGRPQHPRTSLPSLIAPDPGSLSPAPKFPPQSQRGARGGGAAAAAFLPLGTRARSLTPAQRNSAAARPGWETMGLPEQDDTPFPPAAPAAILEECVGGKSRRGAACSLQVAGSAGSPSHPGSHLRTCPSGDGTAPALTPSYTQTWVLPCSFSLMMSERVRDTGAPPGSPSAPRQRRCGVRAPWPSPGPGAPRPRRNLEGRSRA